MPAWSENDVVPIRLLGPTPTPHNVQVDAPEGTAGYLHVEWEAQPDSGTAAYHVRARPTVDTDTAEYRGKYFTGGRFRRVATDVRDYTFYGIVPGITYRSQVCRVTALHAAYAGFDTIGDCSPWQSIRLPAAGDADANDVKVSLEFPDGSATTTLTPDTHGTLHYRVRLSGINDLSQYRSPRWGAGSWALFLKPNESRKTHRLGPGYGQVPEYFGHVHRGANLSHLTWDKPTSGYIDQSFTLTSTMRGRGPLIVELFDHRTDHSNTDLGSQRKLCVDFEDAMGDIAAPCPSGSQQAPEPAAPATVEGAPVLSGAGDDGSWSEGEKVGVTVTFSEAVAVDTTGGTPAIGVTLGGPGGAARSATYESGSGTTELAFGYTLVQGDGTHQHMAVTPNSLAAGGGTVRGAESGVDADLAHAGAAAAGNLARSAAPTAAFEDVPARHDGAAAFKVGLRFSGAPAGLDAKRDAASVLEVAGGSVTTARQAAAGANPVWEVTVTPAGAGGVTVRVPARACSEAHAVCIGGQPLGEAAEAVVPGPPITARFTQAPTEHNGSDAFVLHFSFSHAPTGYSWTTVRDRLFEMTGGRIEKAGRLVKGSNLGWTVRVVPDGGGAVTLSARATTDCAAPYAACDASGRMFDGALATTIAGPDTPEADAAAETSALPTVSIAAPATTPVTEGTALAFTLSRTGSTDAALSVSVAVSESGAVLARGPPATVAFAANSATATLSVPTVDDAAEEDASTVTVTVAAGTGYTVAADASSASGTVESDDLAPITARFTQAPVEHDGSDAFEMRFAFSHAPVGYNWTTVRDRLFAVSGGRIEKAGRVTKGSNQGWKFRVRPDGLGPVTLSARATTDCAAAYAACDAAGRMFDGALAATVLGPPTLSVADAEVEEADGATLDFVVTLSRAVAEAVSVAYATSDGTASSGDDYTAASGSLRFAANEVSKTVSVAVLDDPHDESSETVTFTLSNPAPARVKLADAEATGTITNTDALPRAWIARFGRTVAEQVLDAVEGRMRAGRQPGAEMSLGGERIGLGPLFGARGDGVVAADDVVTAPADVAADPAALGFGPAAGPPTRGRSTTGRDLLLGSSFSLTAGAGEGLVSVWGRGAVTRFDGREDALSLDGDVTSVLVGTDWAAGAWTAGLVVSHSLGDGGYRGGGSAGAGSGTVEATLTGLYPWVRRALGDRLEAWGVAGYGTGELTLRPGVAAAFRTDLDLRLLAAGLRGTVLDGGGDGLTLTATSDAVIVGTSTAAVAGPRTGRLAAAEAEVTRLRLALTARRPVPFGDGAVLTPGLEIGVRHDGGDAETGVGADLGASLAWSDPRRGLSAELRGRGLLTHAADGFRERGLSGALAWEPVANGTGPRLRLVQTLGGPSSGGADALFGRGTLAGLGADGADLPQRRLEARFGYGFAVYGNRFTSLPEIAVGRSDGARDYGLGWRLVRGGGFLAGGALEVAVEARRLEAAGDARAPDRQVGFRVTARW